MEMARTSRGRNGVVHIRARMANELASRLNQRFLLTWVNVERMDEQRMVGKVMSSSGAVRIG